MIQTFQHSASNAKSNETEIALPTVNSSRVDQPVATNAQAATKDAGRVHIGGGLMHFDAGRVHVGGGLMHF